MSELLCRLCLKPLSECKCPGDGCEICGRNETIYAIGVCGACAEGSLPDALMAANELYRALKLLGTLELHIDTALRFLEGRDVG